MSVPRAAARIGLAAGHLELLRAGLGDRATAVAAWRAWSASHCLDDLDTASFRLLPLAYRALSRLGAAPADPRPRGAWKQTWYRTLVLWRAVAAALQALEAARIPVLLFKGLPLALHAYDDAGMRPMQDADLLVPPDRGKDALRTLERLGFSPLPGLTAWPPRLQPGWPLRNRESQTIDLHAQALNEGGWPGADDRLWARAVSRTLRGLEVRVPSDPDHLLHVLVHGSWWNNVAPARWVADATVLLRRAGAAFDWDVFVGEARARRVSLCAAEALDAWHAAVGDAWPVEVRNRLLADVTRGEGWEQRARTRAPDGWLGSLPRLLLLHTRAAPPGAGLRPAELAADLRHNWGLAERESLGGAAARRVLRRTWRALSPPTR